MALTKCARMALTKCARIALTKCARIALLKCARIALTKCARIALTKCARIALTKCNETQYTYPQYYGVLWCDFPNNWKEHTVLILKCPVDKAKLSATTHPTTQHHKPKDQIFILNPNKHYKAFHILQYHY
jgi:hypothetical protein